MALRYTLTILAVLYSASVAQAADSLTTQAPAGAQSAAPAAAPTASAASVKITTNITNFVNNQAVNVSFSGVTKPTDNDVVALFFKGASADVVLPLKYKWARTSPGYTTTGSGSMMFVLSNQRQDVVFQFFRNVTASTGFSNLTYSGTSPVITLSTPNQPLHGHLALTGPSSPTSVLVQWTTKDPGTPTVQYGTASGQYTKNVTGTTHTYTAADMCGSPANSTGYVDPGSMHNVTLSNLTASTHYYYVFGDPTWGFSKEFDFFTPQAVGANSTIHFLAIADLGQVTLDGSDEYDYDWSGDPLNEDATGTLMRAYDTLTQLIYDNEAEQGASRGTVEAMAADKSQNWTLFLHDGDISYARGMETMWDIFGDQMEQLVAKVPWMLTNGNHERDFPGSGDRFGSTGASIDSGGECNVAYSNRYQMPINKTASYQDAYGRQHAVEWYSYDHGPVHFLAMSTEIDFAPGSAQYQFIVSDLAAVNRTKTPWVVVNTHRPTYTTSSSGGSLSSVTGVAADLRAALENVYYQYSVNIVFAGHDHIYERTCPVFRQTCMTNNKDGSQGGPMYVVIGNAGYELSFFANPNVPPYWDVVYLEHGYLRCTTNATSFFCEEVSSVSGNVIDTWRLTLPSNYTAPTPKAMQTKISTFNTPYLTTNLIELYGIPGTNYSIVEDPVYGALLGANISLTEELQSMDTIIQATVNGAVPGGVADTAADIWDVLRPFADLLAEYSAGNATIAAAGQGIAGYMAQVEKVAAVYGSQDGLWFESSRAKQGLFPTVKVGPAPALAPAMAPATSVSTAGRR